LRKYRTTRAQPSGLGTEDSASAGQRQCERNGRGHTDRKQPDGAAIAFVVITLLTVVAFAILLSRLFV
jgi:hypothetical protein